MSKRGNRPASNDSASVPRPPCRSGKATSVAFNATKVAWDNLFYLGWNRTICGSWSLDRWANSELMCTTS
jgi:hypothetical protein